MPLFTLKPCHNVVALAVSASAQDLFLASPRSDSCTIQTVSSTLFHLRQDRVAMVAADSAAECCGLCAAQGQDSCTTWSYSGAKWTPETPCHLSPFPPTSTEPDPTQQYAGGSASVDSCTIQTTGDTLFHVSTHNVDMVAADSPADCCGICAARGPDSCATWSYSGSLWTPNTPCHLSPFAPISTEADPSQRYAGGSVDSAPPAPPAPSPGPPVPASRHGRYMLQATEDGARQTIWGMGFEIQSDSIGSYNTGMPKDGELVPDDDDSTSSAPHDLVESEQERLASEMLTGFRWCRLALGLYLRGLDPEKKQIIGRWPSQMKELKQLQDLSGIEGFAPEYWSPPPAWKQKQSYYGGGLNSTTDAAFLEDFGNALVQDVQYLHDNGLRVPWWGLQNEPNFDNKIITAAECATDITDDASEEFGALGDAVSHDSYGQCHYDQCGYYRTFKAVSPKIKAAFPGIKIHANSARGQLGASPVADDADARRNVDAWTWHYVGGRREVPRTQDLTKGSYGIGVINNEYEYQPSDSFSGSPKSTLNTAMMIMNFFVFADSPGFYWIHALKPSTNVESKGYGLGFWRPKTQDELPDGPWPADLAKQHWSYAPVNWHAVAGFSKHMPWDSVRHAVLEQDGAFDDARIFAFKTPSAAGAGGPLHADETPGSRLGVVLAYGRDDPLLEPFTFEVSADDGVEHVLSGHRYTPDADGYDLSLGKITVPAHGSVNITVPAQSIEFWLEY